MEENKLNELLPKAFDREIEQKPIYLVKSPIEWKDLDFGTIALEQQKTKDMKVMIWDKELCNGAEWNDFLKCVEEKTEENNQLKQQLVEKEKELAYMTKQAKKFNNEAQKYYEDAYCNSFQNQKAIAELKKVKNFVDGRTYCADYINKRIQELKGD